MDTILKGRVSAVRNEVEASLLPVMQLLAAALLALLASGCTYTRAGSSLRLQGCVSLIAIWKTTLTAAQVSNNVAVAAARFGL